MKFGIYGVKETRVSKHRIFNEIDESPMKIIDAHSVPQAKKIAKNLYKHIKTTVKRLS
jgi:hypothetical protein